MQYIPIKTRIMRPPQDDLLAVLGESVKTIHEQDIILITSKVVAIHQGRCIRVEDVEDKTTLVQQEAEAWIAGHDRYTSSPLCIKHGVLFYGAGIDASNSGDYYTLLPTAPFAAARDIHAWLCRQYKVTELGVIITDSHSLPMRRGVMSISIGSWGFAPVDQHVGKTDLFGRPLQFSATNIADAVSAGSSAVCGETDECTPIVIARDVPNISFTTQDMSDSILVPPDEDIYYPLLKPFFAT